jgi:hypothetical protein
MIGAVRLDRFTAAADDTAQWRVEELWPAGGRVLLAAQYKAGKTTLIGNLIRSLVDDELFLDRFGVEPAQRVVLIDDELDERTLRRWLTDQNITNADRVEVVSLRGRVAEFGILTAEGRAPWVEMLTGADAVIVDCLRPMLDALGISESVGAGKFLLAFDALLREAGIGEAVLVHHFGHEAERARGSSRLLDWADANWRLTRAGCEPDAPRHFTAYGRDVDVPSARLWFDVDRRRLTLTDPHPPVERPPATLEQVIAKFEALGATLPFLAPEAKPQRKWWQR